jgi:hypothetical protein
LILLLAPRRRRTRSFGGRRRLRRLTRGFGLGAYRARGLDGPWFRRGGRASRGRFGGPHRNRLAGLCRHRLGRTRGLGLGSASRSAGLSRSSRPVRRRRLRRVRCLLTLLSGTPRPIALTAGLLGSRGFPVPDFSRRTGCRRIRACFLAPCPAFALLALSARRRLRLGQRLFLGPAAVADNGQQISGYLGRRYGACRVVLTQQRHQLRRAHPISEPLRAAVTGRTIRREDRRTGLATLQILGSGLCDPVGKQPENEREIASKCGQGMPPGEYRARRGAPRTLQPCDL